MVIVVTASHSTQGPRLSLLSSGPKHYLISSGMMKTLLPLITPFWELISAFAPVLEASVLVAQLCSTLCDPMDCSPPGFPVHGDSPGKNSRVGCHLLHWQVGSLPLAPPGKLPWWLRWLRICLECRGSGFDSWVRKIPWSREWLPTPISLPGELHGQRSLADYSPWTYRVGHD